MLAHRQSVGLWPDEGGESGGAEPQLPPRVPLDCSNGKRQMILILKSGCESGFVIPFPRKKQSQIFSARMHCGVSFPPNQPAELPAQHWGGSRARGDTFGTGPPRVSLAVMGAFESLTATVLGFIRGGERLGSDFHTSR